MASREEDDELRRWLLSLRPTDYPLVFPGRTREDAEAEAAAACPPENRKAYRRALAAVLLAWQREFRKCHDRDWSAEHGRDREKERQTLPARIPRRMPRGGSTKRSTARHSQPRGKGR